MIPPSRYRPRDLLSEAVAGMLQRPARSALTALGTVLGVGAFVAVLGLTATASAQIDDRFNALTATEVTLEDVAREHEPHAGPAFPADAEERVAELNGLRHAGVHWTVDTGTDRGVHTTPAGPGAGRGAGEDVQVLAASPGVLRAAEATLAQGVIFDPWHAESAQNVAVIGASTAGRLGITTLETHPALFIDGQPFTVIGILDNVERKADLLLSVLIPATTAERIWGPPQGSSARMLLATELGAAQQIAREAPVALRPDHPEYVKAVPPPDPRDLRSTVTGDLQQLLLLLAAICLVIGAVGIANTTLVAVLERTAEIGLRRALGARSRHITAQFLTESATLGALGGLVGTSLGTATVVTVAALREWTPVVHPVTLAAAPVLGLLTGLLAGLYPAWRATRIQPAEALRR
ncbi:ABC transporter permease [Streptomyces sp. ACA25]|nr:ABC transporter permease [Streptomyces sp. ACA25]MDB1086416.1 ABC transporter permease [Streptomyces sp. ACA25]